jgi:hypothetical protein
MAGLHGEVQMASPVDPWDRPPEVKRACKKPCKGCPFKKTALKGWLGAYDGPEEFIGTHYRQDQPNPCHMTVDYERKDWEDQLPDAVGCAGQQIMYLNGFKSPRFWKLDPDLKPDTDLVFQYPTEFIEHHTLKPGESRQVRPENSCYHCGIEVDHEEAMCHGCGEHVCEECEQNHTLMGPHNVMEHLDEPEDLEM